MFLNLCWFIPSLKLKFEEDRKQDDGMWVDDSDVSVRSKMTIKGCRSAVEKKTKTSGPSDFQKIKTRWTTRFWPHLQKNKH